MREIAGRLFHARLSTEGEASARESRDPESIWKAHADYVSRVLWRRMPDGAMALAAAVPQTVGDTSLPFVAEFGLLTGLIYIDNDRGRPLNHLELQVQRQQRRSLVTTGSPALCRLTPGPARRVWHRHA